MTPPQVVVVDGEPQLWEASQQRAEGNVALETGEWGAEAEVDAVPKGEVADSGPLNVEHLGIVVDIVVAIRRRQADDDLGSGGDRDAAQFDRFDGVSKCRVRDRGIETQELLQRGPQPLGIFTQQRQLIGVAEQSDDAVADETGCRVVTGDDQLEDRRAQLPGVEALVSIAGGDQGADEIVTRGSGLDLDELFEHGDDGVGCHLGLGVLLRCLGRDE